MAIYGNSIKNYNELLIDEMSNFVLEGYDIITEASFKETVKRIIDTIVEKIKKCLEKITTFINSVKYQIKEFIETSKKQFAEFLQKRADKKWDKVKNKKIKIHDYNFLSKEYSSIRFQSFILDNVINTKKDINNVPTVEPYESVIYTGSIAEIRKMINDAKTSNDYNKAIKSIKKFTPKINISVSDFLNFQSFFYNFDHLEQWIADQYKGLKAMNRWSNEKMNFESKEEEDNFKQKIKYITEVFTINFNCASTVVSCTNSINKNFMKIRKKFYNLYINSSEGYLEFEDDFDEEFVDDEFFEEDEEK